MKILITGGYGQLGVTLADRLAAEREVELVVTDQPELDLLQPVAVREFLERERPAWVMNCAAFTDVDGAESKPELAYAINERAVGTLADAAAAVGARMMHVSTDYVFSGIPRDDASTSLREDAPTGPVNVYGASKLAGEIRLDRHPARPVVLRTSWLYGGPERNFLQTMLRLGRERRGGGEPLRVIDDQHGTPTDCFSLAEQMVRLLEPDAAELTGVVHASAGGHTTWCGFAREIFRKLDWDVTVDAIPTSEYPTPARRPLHSALANARLEEHGLSVMPEWCDGLSRVLARLQGQS